MSNRSIWDDLVELGPSTSVEGQWLAPASIPEFSFIERIRQALPEELESREATDDLTSWHRQHRGSGLGGTWRGPDDAILSPSWLVLNSIAADAATGNVVAAGRVDYGCWQLGDDAPSFMRVDGIYVGSLRTGNLLPLELDISARSVDLDPQNGEIAVLHHLANSTFAVSIISILGSQRLVCILADLAGYERVRYSPDGRWLLVSRSKGTYVIEAATGKWFELDFGNAAWLPSSPSSLLFVGHDEGAPIPQVFSLESNSIVRSLPPVALDVPFLESFPYVWDPVPSTDGAEVLARSPAGVTVEYQKVHGVGNRIVRFDLKTGRGSLLNSVHVNAEGTLERDAFDQRWRTTANTAWSLSLHSDLSARINEPITTPSDPSWIEPGRWADEAEIVLVSMLNRAISLVQEGASVTHLMPEIVVALRAISTSPAWEQRSEWLTGLRDILMSMVASGELAGTLATPWLRFAVAIRAIEQGQADQITAITMRR